MTATFTPVDQAKASHCIGASHVRDNASREFSLAEQQENQQKFSKISLKIGQRSGYIGQSCSNRCALFGA